MKILIVSYYFAPYNTIGAIRMTKMAKYLERLGHDVQIITATDQPLPKRLTIESDEKKMIRTKWFNPLKLIHSFIGGQHTVSEKGYELSKRGWFLKKLANLYKQLFHFPDGQIGWYPYGVKAGEKLLKNWEADVIVASGAPFTSFLIAKKLSKRFDIPWIADFRDLWVDNANYDYSIFRKKVESWFERKTIVTAASIVTVSEPLAEILRKKYSKQVQVIMNGYDHEDYPPKQPSVIKNERIKQERENVEKLTIVYTGMVYETKQNVEPLFEALAQDKQLANSVAVTFYGRNLQIVERLRNKYKLNDTVTIQSPISHRNALQVQWDADILLLLLWNDSSQKGIYTGKLFEYLGARRPILAIGNGNDVAAKLINSFQRGKVCTTANDIARQLHEWSKIKTETTITRLPAIIREGFTRKEQAVQLEQLIRQCILRSEET
jgi:glycosyltransferase involved in cell wall biosynthesis